MPVVNNNPEHSLVLTFDDGFASNREHAWPVLERNGFPSATFVVTDYLGGYNIWDGPSRASYSFIISEGYRRRRPCAYDIPFPQRNTSGSDISDPRFEITAARTRGSAPLSC